ncbi:hypothetical protein [Actinoplanes sp. G11-F43]|uniref:hypothetical protein n=1 Tax=Actinoplanes sp. G11-F43 TaxID=3424130 RepID=UPI003D3597FE
MRLHEVMDLAASGAPQDTNTVDDIVGRGRRVQRRRRAAFAGAGAALAVVAVSAGVVVPSLGRDTSRPAPAVGVAASTAPPTTWRFPADPFRFTFGAFDAGRWHVGSPQVVSTAYQIAPVRLDGRKTSAGPAGEAAIRDMMERLERGEEYDTGPWMRGTLVVYRPGAFDPAGLTGATEVTVDGAKAYEATGSIHNGMITQRSYAWTYAPDAWAVLSTSSDSAQDPSAAELRELAPGLRPAEPAPAKLPFTLGHVPAGYQPVEVESPVVTARDEDGFGSVVFADPAPATTGLTEPYDGNVGRALPGSFEIAVVPAEQSNVSADGTAIRCVDGLCVQRTADGGTSVEVSSGGRLSDAAMTRILQGLQLRDVTDASTWADASTALGG